LLHTQFLSIGKMPDNAEVSQGTKTRGPFLFLLAGRHPFSERILGVS
jgi:hypothetical protein